MSNPVVSSAVNPADRRRAPRFSCDFSIAIEWGAAVLEGVVKEISADGMFVELESPLWIGARFAARLNLEQPVSLDCVVCRVEPHRGMALTFAAPSGVGALSRYAVAAAAGRGMTHCLNCGAERDADQCLACGLTGSGGSDVAPAPGLAHSVVFGRSGRVSACQPGISSPGTGFHIDFRRRIIFCRFRFGTLDGAARAAAPGN